MPAAARPLLVALRAGAALILLLLLLDPAVRRPGAAGRPLVLLDTSLSLAAAWGEVRPFGDSRLAPALRAAAADERRVVVVTDGVIRDLAELPPDLLARATVRLFPRAPVADVAVTRLEAPSRIALGDTLRVTAEVVRSGPATGPARVELRGAAGRALAGREVRLDGGRESVTLALPTRALGAGTHQLAVRVLAAGDSVPEDDVRELLVTVTTLPAAVLLAAPPDWDARQLLATLREVASLPVRGYASLGPAGWRRMPELAPVTAAEVARATRGAELLILKGDPGEAARGARPRALWRWPSGEGGESVLDGEWYPVDASAPSPLAGAWAATPMESLPPLERLTPVVPGPRDWVGLSVQLGRRGAERPAVIGREVAGRREVQVAADGLWRWAFRPGLAEETYRQFVDATASWLLDTPDPAAGAARPVTSVVPRDRPVRFRWTGEETPRSLAVTVTGDGGARTDTLVFDGAREAALPLPVGRWEYRLAGGGVGTVVVEPWSDEYVPAPATLAAHPGTEAATGRRTALRDQWWPYALVVLLLGLEWWWRRRLGLR